MNECQLRKKILTEIEGLLDIYFYRRDEDRYEKGLEEGRKEYKAFLYLHERCLKTKRYGIEGRWYGKLLNAPDSEKEYQESDD